MRNKFSGQIPDIFNNLPKLSLLTIASNLFSGEVPSSLWSILDNPYFDGHLDLSYNNLTGTIPLSTTSHPKWSSIVFSIIRQNTNYGFDLGQTKYYFPSLKSTDMDDHDFFIYDVFKSNKLTVWLFWAESCFYSEEFMENNLKRLYDQYHSKGLEIVGFTPYEMEKTQTIQFINNHNLPWINTYKNDPYFNHACLSSFFIPDFLVMDETGAVVMNGGDRYALESFVIKTLGQPDVIDLYQSADYSMDGLVAERQKATKGLGIDLVILGDGFADIDQGLFNGKVTEAIDHFFSLEPTKSYKDYFNIYQVHAVSKNNEYDYTDVQTAFNVTFGEGTYMEGDNAKCTQYALKAPIKNIDKTLIIVLVNSKRWAGTCHWYTNGTAFAYVPSTGYGFQNLLVHEAIGHGFGKLADEYATYSIYIPAEEKAYYNSYYTNYGWFSNIDFTNDLNQIRWKSFINHPKYSHVGAYEGGGLYSKGVWRPEVVSCMDDNRIYFNAPSREAIYKQIMTLSGGSYSWNGFVTQDVEVLPMMTRTTAPDLPKERLAPPVVIKGSPLEVLSP
jgi:hypothetical protein